MHVPPSTWTVLIGAAHAQKANDMIDQLALPVQQKSELKRVCIQAKQLHSLPWHTVAPAHKVHLERIV